MTVLLSNRRNGALHPNVKIIEAAFPPTSSELFVLSLTDVNQVLKHKFTLQKQNTLNKAHVDRMKERNSNEE